ncbi:MAG: DUF4373 domain-containing protein [Lachnospiraceae bacterium]|nr:DUF4373 domain-containing protein [Lachnospiraceae bacterium]
MTKGRPRRQGLTYYPFDVDFFSDEKVVCIAGEFGLKGEIAMIKLLCAVYRNGYFLEWNDMIKMKLLHSLPGVSAELLEQIVNRLVRWGFFCRSLFDSDKILTSEGIQRRYFEAIKFRILPDELPYLLIDNFKNYTHEVFSQKKNAISQKKNPFFQEEIPQKENKIKKNNIKKSSKIAEPSLSADETKFKALTFEEKLSLLKSDEAWVNSMCENFHISKQKLIETIDNAFAPQCVNGGYDDSIFRLSDLKRQVSKWMTARKYKNDETKQEDRFSERRGTEPAAKSRKGFQGTF